jgi:hypothetical protein
MFPYVAPMKFKFSAKALRKEIGELDFEFWVRKWSDHSISCGAIYSSEKRRDKLAVRLTELGYTTQIAGKPGTAGWHTLEITGKNI